MTLSRPPIVASPLVFFQGSAIILSFGNLADKQWVVALKQSRDLALWLFLWVFKWGRVRKLCQMFSGCQGKLLLELVIEIYQDSCVWQVRKLDEGKEFLTEVKLRKRNDNRIISTSDGSITTGLVRCDCFWKWEK